MHAWADKGSELKWKARKEKLTYLVLEIPKIVATMVLVSVAFLYFCFSFFCSAFFVSQCSSLLLLRLCPLLALFFRVPLPVFFLLFLFSSSSSRFCSFFLVLSPCVGLPLPSFYKAKDSPGGGNGWPSKCSVTNAFDEETYALAANG